MRVISFKASEDFLFLLDEVARRLGVSRSELIRRAVTYYAHYVASRDRPYQTRRIRVY